MENSIPLALFLKKKDCSSPFVIFKKLLTTNLFLWLLLLQFLVYKTIKIIPGGYWSLQKQYIGQVCQ
jgi:hypothetical protein